MGYNKKAFRSRVSVCKSERKQGLIFYLCKNYVTALSDEEQIRLKELVSLCAHGNDSALMEYLTHDVGVEYICAKYTISRGSLYRYSDAFYNNFDYVKKF